MCLAASLNDAQQVIHQISETLGACVLLACPRTTGASGSLVSWPRALGGAGRRAPLPGLGAGGCWGYWREAGWLAVLPCPPLPPFRDRRLLTAAHGGRQIPGAWCVRCAPGEPPRLLSTGCCLALIRPSSIGAASPQNSEAATGWYAACASMACGLRTDDRRQEGG